MKKIYTFLMIAIVFIAKSQLVSMGDPISFTHSSSITKSVPIVDMPNFDLNQMLYEDSINNYNKVGPWRFGKNFSVNYNLENSGTWDVLNNGSRIWRLRITSEDALSINLIFDKFYLPEGAHLMMYSIDSSHIVGAYTSVLNNSSEMLGSELVLGDDIVVEYFEPASAIGEGILEIGTITHAYKALQLYGDIIVNAYGSSGSCNYDVDCPAGNGKENQINSVAMIVVNGNGACTGALVNNTNNDGTPYFLTANHCLGNPGSWVFRFNWHATNPSCGTTANSGNGSFDQTSFTSTLRASNAGSDVALVELNGTIPPAWNPYYAGWDRSDVVPNSAYGIHHPRGDLKKICLENDPLTKQNWQGAQCWEVANWDVGVTEPGSSGSPLFDANGRIIGQLFGGTAACSGTNDNGQPDYYGRFGISWDNGANSSSRLRDWLDPSNSNVTQLDGYDPNSAVVALDAGILSIDEPSTDICGLSFTPEVTLRNYGSNTLTSCAIRYRINGGALQTLNWTGSLAANATASVTLNPMTATNGTNSLEVYTQNPNGTSDQNTSNDDKTINFDATQASSLPLTQGFENATFPPANYSLSNADNSTTWARTTTAASLGNASIFMDNYNYNANGAYDWFILPALNFSNTTAATLSFDYAYAYYDGPAGTFYDSLYVAFSPDCGDSWFALFYEGGIDLETAPAQQPAFVPTANDWVTETIDLDLPQINNASSITFAFIGVNAYGNNLYIDNINISAPVVANPPVADFTASSTTVCEGTTINFTNQSTNNPTTNVWSFPNGTPNSSNAVNPSVTYNSPGVYQVSLTATNADGSDTETKTGYITVRPEPNLSINKTDVSCNGGNDGSATVSISNGFSPYTFSWTNSSAASATANNLSDGTYTVTVTNSAGCTNDISTTVSEPTPLTLAVNTTDDNCSQGQGSAVANASGGSAPYSYVWSGGSGSNLNAGNYSVTVTDNKGCTKTENFTIGNNTPNYTISVSTTPASCGANNGTAVATVNGVTSGFTFSFSNGNSTGANSVNGLAFGTYTVTITDANNCEQTQSFSIANANAPSISSIATSDVSCNGASDGTATASVIGGTPPFTYSWGPSNTVSNLSSGSYTLTVSDANGCQTQEGYVIDEPQAITVTEVIVDEHCNQADGSIQVSTSGGSGSYTYLWNGTNGSSLLNNLTQGNYTLVVTDDNNCTLDTTYTLTNEAAPSIQVNSVLDACTGQNSGSIDVTVIGGTGILDFDWTISNSEDLQNVPSGTYTLTVTDAFGCSDVASATINDISPNFSTDLTVIDNGSTSSIESNVSGGVPPYSYAWSSGEDTADLYQLSQGEYILTVTDANGCQTIDTATVGSVAIQQANWISYISLYPNPTNSTITLDYSFDSKQDVSIEIYNTLGQVIVAEQLINTQQNKLMFDMQSNASGVYFVKISNSESAKLMRFVKE